MPDSVLVSLTTCVFLFGSGAELAVVELVLAGGELAQLQGVEQLQPLLQSGATHQPEQLAEAAEVHLSGAGGVHKLRGKEEQGVLSLVC